MLQSNHANHRFIGRALFAGGLLLLSALLAACQGRGEGRDAEKSVAIQLQPDAPSPGFTSTAVDASPTSLVLTLQWRGPLPTIGERPWLVFCLPAERSIRATWLEGQVGKSAIVFAEQPGGAVLAAEPQPVAEAGLLQSAGIVRHWPLYRMQAAQSIYQLLEKQRLTQPDAPLTLKLQLSWAEPFEPVPVNPEPDPAGVNDWRKVMESLVLNPQDLDRYAVVQASLPANVSVTPTDPRRLAPAAVHWARLRIREAGLYRLSDADLVRAGFPAAAGSLDAVRIFSHGRAVPAFLAADEGVPAGLPAGLYFWAHGGEGTFSPDRVYWLTLDAQTPPLRLNRLPVPEDAAAAQPVASVLRTMRVDDDRQFVTRHGHFMAFLGMSWVQSPLIPGQPLLVPVHLPFYQPGDQSIQAKVRIFSERERALTLVRLDVGVGLYPQTTFEFGSDQDTLKQFDLPPDRIVDGATTISLHLNRRYDQPGSAAEADLPGGEAWFDWLTVQYPAEPRLLDGRLSIPLDQFLTTAAADAPATGTQAVWVPMPDLATSPGLRLVALAIDPREEPLGLMPIAQPAGRPGPGLTLMPERGHRIEVFNVARLPRTPLLEPAQWDELLDAGEGSDLLIVTHAEFREAAERLAAARRAGGVRVRVADVQTIYDFFSNGESTPLAIRSCLAYMLREWNGKAPSNVLLVGDSSSDYAGQARNGVRNWIPSYTYEDGIDHYASDYWMTTVAGNDPYGDYMIGRLSVASREDAQAVVDKLLAYEQEERSGVWRDRLGLVADSGEFRDVMEDLDRTVTPPQYLRKRVYLDDFPLEDNWILSPDLVDQKEMKISRQATRELLTMFRDGASMVIYYGHGSPNIWSNDRMWFGGDSPNSDNLMLEGSGRYSFVINMTCNTGAIDYPLRPWNICITEDLMRVRGGGAIACFVPSGPGSTLVHRSMNDALWNALFGHGLRRLGAVTTGARLRYQLNDHPEGLSFMYLLLGDPLTRLQLAERRGTFTPDPAAVAPGGTIPLRLTELVPQAGTVHAELIAEDQNRLLWRSDPVPYMAGRIALDIPVPADAADGRARLHLYCWPGEQSGEKSTSLAGDFQIVTPWLALGAVHLGPPERDGTRRLSADVLNPAALSAQGSLTTWVEDRAGTHPLETRALDGAAQVTLDVAADPPTTGVRWLVTELRSRSAPANPALPQVERRRLLLAAAPGWTGWLPDECRIDEDPSGRERQLIVQALVADGPSTPTAAWRGRLQLAGIPPLISEPLILRKDGRQWLGETSIALGALTPDRLSTGLLVLECTQGAEPARPVDRLSLARIERAAPQLRIVPDSIRHVPFQPTEGETVTIGVTVENAGQKTSGPVVARLLTGSPVTGDQPARARVGGGSATIPALAPGRRTTVQLRWDPVRNAGVTPLWISLSARPGYGAREENAQELRIEIAARSKPALAIGRTWVEAEARDYRLNRVHFNAQIVNRGQTAAQEVNVAFYRSAVQIDENKIGEVLLPVVPADGTATATLTWRFDPQRDLVGGQLPPATIQAWLKGSVRPPISSIDPAELGP